MKKLLIALFMMFAGVAFADTGTVTWYNEDLSSYETTTCTIGGDIILPTPPTKTGYTFVGWTSLLPDGYTQLEYVESTGTQYIDTGVVAATGLDIEVIVKLMSYGSIFGSRHTTTIGGTLDAIWFSAREERTIWLYGNSTLHNHLAAISLNVWHTIRTIGGAYYLDGTLVAAYDGQTIPDGQNMLLFTTITESSIDPSGDLQISRFIIRDSNSNVIRDFIPAKRNSDNEVGMYDVVSGTFFTNAGTGAFIAGPVVQ